MTISDQITAEIAEARRLRARFMEQHGSVPPLKDESDEWVTYCVLRDYNCQMRREIDEWNRRTGSSA